MNSISQLNIFKRIGSFNGFRTKTSSPKNIFMRNFFRFFCLYPSRRAYYFYYEKANSFMAPKMFEYSQMFKDVEIKKNDVILDLGCGEGSLTLILGKLAGKVIGIDTLQHCIKDANFKARELSGKVDAEFLCSRLEEAELQEQSIDKVVSFSVIEHIPNYIEVFEEIFKILKVGGELIFSVDSFSHFDKEQREVHRKNFKIEKYFEKEELQELLQNLGFKDVKVEAIFKSKFAENWFTRVMNNPGEYFGSLKRFYSFFLYYLIAYHERKVGPQEHGIFLVARCTK